MNLTAYVNNTFLQTEAKFLQKPLNFSRTVDFNVYLFPSPNGSDFPILNYPIYARPTLVNTLQATNYDIGGFIQPPVPYALNDIFEDLKITDGNR